jgi:cyclic beta-1,2-glucan synthetase
LGSVNNDECRIDAIAQSWSALSGAAPAERVNRALNALKAQLVKPQARLIQLLDPPFDKSTPNPGYIRGYVPGVRENGGQYTHAAIWAVMAFVEAGRTAQAWELFDLINPLSHAATPPVEPHTGRGGWTWYTGSAGWMYRLIVESLLGLRREGNTLRIDPRLPESWPGFRFVYRHGRTIYRVNVVVTAPGSAPSGVTLLALNDDGGDHAIEVTIDRASEPATSPTPQVKD